MQQSKQTGYSIHTIEYDIEYTCICIIIQHDNMASLPVMKLGKMRWRNSSHIFWEEIIEMEISIFSVSGWWDTVPVSLSQIVSLMFTHLQLGAEVQEQS